MVFKRCRGFKGRLIIGPILTGQKIRNVERFFERKLLIKEDWDFVAFTYKLGDGYYILVCDESFPKGEFERLVKIAKEGQAYPVNFAIRYRVSHDILLCRRYGCWHAGEEEESQLEAIQTEYGDVIDPVNHHLIFEEEQLRPSFASARAWCQRP